MVIGITGGIGSGKSTVCKILTDKGCKVLFADNIAKSIMNNDINISGEIIDIFGTECYSNGKLESKILAEKVFNHPDKISKLNSIVHPPTIKKIKEDIAFLNDPKELLFIEVPLLFEAKMVDLFDYIFLVTAESDIRIRRVLERDNVSAAEIKGRIDAQIPEEQKKGRADFILENNSTLKNLKEKTIFFLNLFKSLIPHNN